MLAESERLLVLGASTRAAAASALRAGFAPVCGDRFGDVDLRERCPVTVAEDYPAGLERLALASPPGAWMYTGALENFPRLVMRISRHRPLDGNAAQVLRQVRDPIQIAAAVSHAGLPCPACRKTADSLPVDGTWLKKRVRSSGGTSVQPWRGEGKNHLGCYFQQRIAGTPCAAIYVAAAGRARLLGVTEQLLTAGFRYAGSVGPLRLEPDVETLAAELGSVLAREFGLVGLFGVDAVLAHSAIWPVEINPRYTASIEVLERALGLLSIALHAAACRQAQLPADAPAALASAPAWCGKAIYYARTDVVISAGFTSYLAGLNEGRAWPVAADIPSPGTFVRAGQPVATALAEAANREVVLGRLQGLLQEFDCRLG